MKSKILKNLKDTWLKAYGNQVITNLKTFLINRMKLQHYEVLHIAMRKSLGQGLRNIKNDKKKQSYANWQSNTGRNYGHRQTEVAYFQHLFSFSMKQLLIFRSLTPKRHFIYLFFRFVDTSVIEEQTLHTSVLFYTLKVTTVIFFKITIAIAKSVFFPMASHIPSRCCIFTFNECILRLVIAC